MNGIKNYMTRAFLSLGILLSTVVVFAQEKKLDVDIDVNDKSSTWYMQPWVWVVGAAVFILLLVAILRSGRRA